MVRHLLATRFAFRSHVERRQTDVYDLVLARRDRTLGPKARRATVDCMPFHLDTRSRAQSPRDPSGREQCPVSDMTVADGEMLTQRFYGMTAPHFASQLSSRVGRLVIDKTGLSGLYNFDVTWRRDDPEASSDFAPLSDQRAVFIAALSQQLGLRLEPARSMVESLVVDSIERPTPN